MGEERLTRKYEESDRTVGMRLTPEVGVVVVFMLNDDRVRVRVCECVSV